MSNREIVTKLLITGFLTAIAALFIAAALAWQGELWVYVVFSVAFFLMLAVGIKRRVSFGFIFLTATLWLGFWLKMSLHTISNSLRWMEPTGLFDFSPSSWDQVALLSSLGALAVMCAGLVWKGRVEDNWQPIDLDVSTRTRLTVWAITLSVVMGVVFLNEYFAINHAGLAPPVLDVPWPLQGLFNWFTGATLLILLAPLYLEMVSGRSLFVPTAIVLAAGAAIAISIGSRGTLAYQSAWIILVALTYRAKIRWLNWHRIALLVLLCTSAVLIVAVASQMRREAWRQVAVQLTAAQQAEERLAAEKLAAVRQVAEKQVAEKQVAEKQAAEKQAAEKQAAEKQAAEKQAALKQAAVKQAAVKQATTNFIFSPQTLVYVMHLPIDRWIGLEGLMAVHSYPEKGTALLLRAITEKGVRGKADLYTSEISRSGTRDTTNFAYVTLPGMFAYWYYSNSRVIMFGMTFVLVLLAIAIERTVNRTTNNPLFAVSIGLTAAIAINMSPGGLFIPTVMLALNVGLILMLGLLLRQFTTHRSA